MRRLLAKILGAVLCGAILLMPSTPVLAADAPVERSDKNITNQNVEILDTGESFTVEIPEEETGTQTPGSRDATGYTTKSTVVSQATEKAKLLKTLKTSSVWGTPANSVRPEISVKVEKSNSVSFSASNGSGTVSVSTTVTFSKAETYKASPKARGWRVSLGIYGTSILTQRIKIDYYSNGSGKYSHSTYINRTTVTSPYIGKRDFQ